MFFGSKKRLKKFGKNEVELLEEGWFMNFKDDNPRPSGPRRQRVMNCVFK